MKNWSPKNVDEERRKLITAWWERRIYELLLEKKMQEKNLR